MDTAEMIAHNSGKEQPCHVGPHHSEDQSTCSQLQSVVCSSPELRILQPLLRGCHSPGRQRSIPICSRHHAVLYCSFQPPGCSSPFKPVDLATCCPLCLEVPPDLLTPLLMSQLLLREPTVSGTPWKPLKITTVSYACSPPTVPHTVPVKLTCHAFVK